MTGTDRLHQNQSHLRQAAECWAKGNPLEAGKLIYENLPSKARPKWAARILKLVLDESRIQSPLLDQVLTAADNEAMWKSGHQAFSSLRQMMLQLDESRLGSGLTKDEELLASVIALGELVSKVVYNATYPPDEFDEDSGWWIATSLRWFVDHAWDDERFAKAAWSLLCSCE